MNVLKEAVSMDCGSPWPGKPKKRRAWVKFETPATASTASFQSGKARDVANAVGSGCLYAQIVDTRYGTFSSKMFSASLVRPPHVELYSALIGRSLYTAIIPRVSVTAWVDNRFSVP